MDMHADRGLGRNRGTNENAGKSVEINLIAAHKNRAHHPVVCLSEQLCLRKPRQSFIQSSAGQVRDRTPDS